MSKLLTQSQRGSATMVLVLGTSLLAFLAVWGLEKWANASYRASLNYQNIEEGFYASEIAANYLYLKSGTHSSGVVPLTNQADAYLPQLNPALCAGAFTPGAPLTLNRTRCGGSPPVIRRFSGSNLTYEFIAGMGAVPSRYCGRMQFAGTSRSLCLATAVPGSTPTPSPTASPSPSPLPSPTPLPCTGVRVSEGCWYLSASGQSCTQKCNSVDRDYDPVTDTFAGNSGNGSNCRQVVSALIGNVSGQYEIQQPSRSPYGVGCVRASSVAYRYYGTATLPDASLAGYNRVCACK